MVAKRNTRTQSKCAKVEFKENNVFKKLKRSQKSFIENCISNKVQC